MYLKQGSFFFLLSASVIHMAMVNFSHNRNTLSGRGLPDDTMPIFQAESGLSGLQKPFQKLAKVNGADNIKNLWLDFKLWASAHYNTVTYKWDKTTIYSNEKFDIEGRRRDNQMRIYANHTAPSYWKWISQYI